MQSCRWRLVRATTSARSCCGIYVCRRARPNSGPAKRIKERFNSGLVPAIGVDRLSRPAGGCEAVRTTTAPTVPWNNPEPRRYYPSPTQVIEIEAIMASEKHAEIDRNSRNTFRLNFICGLRGKLLGRAGPMDAEEYRRNARRYLVRARQMASPENRAILIDLAARWMRLAERSETTRPVQQQQQQVQPKKDNRQENKKDKK